MPPYEFMSAAAQTAFANLLGPAKQAHLNRTVASLPGGFSKKQIRAKTYWYYQYKVEGRLIQIYVGPDTEGTRRLIEQHQNDASVQSSASHLRRLCAAAIALGCVPMPPAHARVLKRLSDHGFFHAGGILIGTHAFMSYQNMLGVVWSGGTVTMDMDFAHPGKNMAIAMPSGLKIDAHKAIESLEMGFLPNASQTTYTKKGETDFELDFVTSQGRDQDTPQHIDSLNITLQPLKFMEYSMEDVLQTAILTPDGPIVVNVPSPERYALHKLLVTGERPREQATKAHKDIEQANCLLAYLADHQPGALEDAHHDMVSRGKGWRQRFDEGLTLLRRRHPETPLGPLTTPLQPD